MEKWEQHFGIRRVEGLKWILKRCLVGAFILAVLWILGEKRTSGDALSLMNVAILGKPFIIKEAGGSFLFFAAAHFAEMTGFKYSDMLRLIICFSGAFFFISLYELVCQIFESRLDRILGVAFLVVPGYARIFFGHIEVYAFLLLAICLYFFFSILCFKGKVGISLPSFFLGVALWIHLSSAFLLPSLLYLHFTKRTSIKAKSDLLRLVTKSTIAVILPFTLFFLALALAGYWHVVVEEVLELTRQIGTRGKAWSFPLIVPFLESRTCEVNNIVLVQYHFFSRSHLLFLANANFILSPVGLITLALSAAYCINKKSMSDPILRFLCVASLFMLIYALIIYPFYWAYDWDLFSATAFCYTVLAVYLLFHYFKNKKTVRYLATYLTSVSLFFNTLPFVLLSSADNIRQAGPFCSSLIVEQLTKYPFGNPDAHYR
jgi:hypothetical protein